MINLGSIFSKSPFKPLREHMTCVMRSVIPLPQFFEALHTGDDAQLLALKDKVFEAEEAADVIKNEIRNHLPHSIFLPINRRDLLAVLDMQDSIADTAQDIVALLEIRKMKLPEKLWQPMKEYIDLNEQACAMASKVSEEFEALVSSGFGRHHGEKLLKMIDQVGDLETKTDEIGIHLTKLLFEVEAEMNPVDVVFWYQLFQDIGDLADYAEKMGNRLRLLIAD